MYQGVKIVQYNMSMWKIKWVSEVPVLLSNQKKIFSLGLFLLLHAIVACTTPSEQEARLRPPEAISLMEEKLRLQDDDVHKPHVRIQAIDTFLILLRRNEPYIKIYG